jgi:hypothetical protein
MKCNLSHEAFHKENLSKMTNEMLYLERVISGFSNFKTPSYLLFKGRTNRYKAEQEIRT